MAQDFDLDQLLADRQLTWLVTGAAGFIGSNLVEALLKAGQSVVGLDNFATGHQRNVDDASALAEGRGTLRMIEGDIRDRRACADAVTGVDVVLHQAALGSVPRSIADPLTSHDVNVTGFLNMLDAARIAGVTRFVYAASSSTDWLAQPRTRSVGLRARLPRDCRGGIAVAAAAGRGDQHPSPVALFQPGRRTG